MWGHLFSQAEQEIDVLVHSGLSLSGDAGVQKIFKDDLYEPGGNRIELCNPVARLLLAPDWRTITWTQAEHAMGQAWGPKTIESSTPTGRHRFR